MLLITDDLIDRLNYHLALTERLDVAVAWATPSKAVELILNFAQDHPNRVRLIVGVSGNATYPPTLRAFHRLAQLRLPRTNPLFHPKVFIFHQKHQTVAWAGSANLTRGGFEQNTELVSESVDDGSFGRWFEDQWSRLEDDPSLVIERYAEQWRPPLPPVSRDYENSLPEIRVSDQQFENLIQNITDWKSFVSALEIANIYWKQNYDFSVNGDVNSWLNTITLGNEIVKRKNWDYLSKTDYHIMMGIDTDTNNHPTFYGLLGSMRGAGDAKNVFNEASPQNLITRDLIRRALQPVLDANYDDFPEHAVSFIRTTGSIPGFSGGVSTRLLALARPDLAVSVNNGSRKGLAAWSNLPAGALSNPPKGPRAASYLSLLNALRSQPWYANPDPVGAYERSLAGARAALLDCLVYRP